MVLMLLLQLLSSLKHRSAHCSVSSSNNSSGNFTSRDKYTHLKSSINKKKEKKKQNNGAVQLTNLWHQRPLSGKTVLQVESALVTGHAVEKYLQYSTQDTLLGLGQRHSLRRGATRKHVRYDSVHFLWLTLCLHSHTWTMISKVSRIIRLASVARLPSISASCSSSALVL